MEDLNKASGVDYDKLDDEKLRSQRYARETGGNIEGRFSPNAVPYEGSRGESAFVVREGNHFRVYVIEGLGTLNLAADAYQLVAPVPGSRYDVVGYNGVASIVNDLITPGALPMVVGQYLAVGDEQTLADNVQDEALARGFKEGCDTARCVWGGGETPALKGIIVPGTIDLAGFAAGRTPGLKLWRHQLLAPGDCIVMLESNGVHMNGFTAVREKVAEGPSALLPSGYRTLVGDTGRTLGDHLLQRAHIYTQAVEFVHAEGFDVHYAVHISGHGWRKLMRAPQPFTYRIHTLPSEQPLFPFLQQLLGYNNLTMYSSYIMRAGFALFMPEHDAGRFVRRGERQGWPYRPFIAGRVEAGPKQVIIEPLGNLPLPGDSMNIR